MSLAIQESSTEEQRHQRYQCVSWKLLTDDKGSLPISAVCILIRAAANLLHQLSNHCFAHSSTTETACCYDYDLF